MTWHTPEVRSILPEGRRSHSALNIDDKLWIFGGFNGRENIHFDKLWCFDPVLREWQFLTVTNGNLGPCKRRRQAMCLVGKH